MSYMFSDCESLNNLNISKFDTRNVNNMSFMFSDSKALKILKINNFNTRNVNDMRYMFSNCYSLDLDINSNYFNIKNVKDWNV